MRRMFDHFGCNNCKEARRAVLIFNSRRPPERQISCETLEGEGWFHMYPQTHKWDALMSSAYKDEELKKIPLLIFDNIKVIGINDFESYLIMLERLDKEV